MTGRRSNARPILIGQVNLLWYVPTALAIAAMAYAAAAGWLPGWLFMLVLFALFMWVFSLGFALYGVLTAWLAKRKESR